MISLASLHQVNLTPVKEHLQSLDGKFPGFHFFMTLLNDFTVFISFISLAIVSLILGP